MGSKSKKSKNSSDDEAEDDYEMMDPIEHVLKRSDTYVGSLKIVKQYIYMYDDESGKIIMKKVQYSPAFLKIFDEIIVNARDHSTKDKTCTKIKVEINKETGWITVYNNGKGIPCKMNEKAKMLVPEMISRNLRTSSNFKDGLKKKRTTGGKNGIGMKATNIFCTEFIFSTLDSKRKKLFKQRSYENMYKCDKAKVTSSEKASFTKVEFLPDYKRFGMDGLTDDVIGILRKRVYDLSATTGKKVDVYYNSEKIKTKSFKDYVDLYFKTDNNEEQEEEEEAPEEENEEGKKKKKESGGIKKVYQEFGNRWKVCVVYDPNSDGFKQISFVNGIATMKGGTHVDYITNQLVKKLVKCVKKKDKTLKISSASIQENITIFIDAIIEEPGFSSQVKDFLETDKKDFGSECELDSKFITKVAKTGLLEELIANARLKQLGSLTKTNAKKGSLKDIEKLEDAEYAGKKNKEQTRLILTEGDSAKAFAMEGLTKIGRKFYGVFPLKGKMLNVRDVKVDKVISNEEIKNLISILGLKHGEKYKDRSKLRYGGVIILTDQDTDGSHIKGLFINFLHTYWPSLLKYNKDFVQSMRTPIVKAFKGSIQKAKKDSKNKIKTFYTMAEFHTWRKENPNGWVIKYYKGLGTSDKKEARDSFEKFEKRLMSYVWQEEEDKTNSDSESKSSSKTNNKKKDKKKSKKNKDINSQKILLAFDKKKADQRKVWLDGYNKDKYIEETKMKITFPEFIDYDLINFSTEDNERSIPSIKDGFKPSIRKIYYGAHLENLYKKEAKVAQLSGAIIKSCDYHHGEMSLHAGIVGVAQNYIGSNNINLLVPAGQFGSRLKGGKDHASARYISTSIEPIASLIIRKEDAPVLKYTEDEGQTYEPVAYAPILPLILVNGTAGIGTGYSTDIPCYNPKDIVKNIRRMLKGGKPKMMTPWYRGYKGDISQSAENKKVYKCMAKIKQMGSSKLKITDLPIGTWSESYKKFLIKMCDSTSTKKGKEKKTYIADYNYGCAGDKVEIDIYFHDGELEKHMENETSEMAMLKKLKLIKNIGTTNMHLYDLNGKIKKYKNVKEIMSDYYEFRIKTYAKRRKYYLKKLKRELELLTFKVKFIEYYIANKIIIKNVKKDVLEEKLKELEFPQLALGDAKKSYKYLLDMPIRQLTYEKVKELKQEYDDKMAEVKKMKKSTPESLWEDELQEFEAEYSKWFAEWEKQLEENVNADLMTANDKKGKIRVRRPRKKNGAKRKARK